MSTIIKQVPYRAKISINSGCFFMRRFEWSTGSDEFRHKYYHLLTIKSIIAASTTIYCKHNPSFGHDISVFVVGLVKFLTDLILLFESLQQPRKHGTKEEPYITQHPRDLTKIFRLISDNLSMILIAKTRFPCGIKSYSTDFFLKTVASAIF